MTDPNVTPNRVVKYGYGTAGNLISVTDANGGVTQFTYDTSHRMSSMKDPNCVANKSCKGIVNTYYTSGQVATQTDQLGRPNMFSYSGDPSSASGGTTTITDPKGNVISTRTSTA